MAGFMLLMLLMVVILGDDMSSICSRKGYRTECVIKQRKFRLEKATNRRHKSDCHSVYDKYENRRCESNGIRYFAAGETAGCEIIRCAIPTMEAAKSLEEDKKTDSHSFGGGHSF